MNKHFAQMEITSCDYPPTRRGHQRRLALLLSANELFLERGYDAVSLDDIVHHAGGSKTSIYKYFGNKEGLFRAICDYRRAVFFKDICPAFEQSKDDLRVYLIRNLNNFYRNLVANENAAFFRMIVEHTKTAPEFALYIHEQGPKVIQTVIAKALENAHNQNVLYCPKPMFSAQLYLGIIRHLEWKTLMGINIEIESSEVEAYFEYSIDRFLDGHQIA